MDPIPEKVVVVDFDIPQLFNNKIFNPAEAVSVHHTILPICYLYRQARERGITLMTQDVFFNMGSKPRNVLLMSLLITPYTDKLIAAGAKPVILSCQESPFIATKFYLNLKKISARFKHSLVFSGMQKRLSARTDYRQMFFPTVYNPGDFHPLPFAQKKYLTMVSGNKHMGNRKKNILLKLYYGFGVREIYSLRQEAVNFFSNAGNFDLYGFGWDRGAANESDSGNIKKVYRGPVADKLPVLSQYKFTFCFENCVFPGYVTEKIFDALFAGSVPVYLGAPDIENFIPEGAFVDMRKFKNFKDLELFLLGIDELAYERYLKNIRAFLASQVYHKFSQEYFAEEVLEIFKKEFEIL